MADSPVFDHVCSALEQRTDMDRLEARGTVRIALKGAGLDVGTVDAEQMAVVLRRVMPDELGQRGVEGAAELCGAIADGLGGVAFDVAADRSSRAADAMARLGS